MNSNSIPELLNHTFTDVYQNENYNGDNLVFVRNDGKVFRFYHSQSCCESVAIEDICGDLSDLVGSPLLIAEECENTGTELSGEGTWTFYKFSTIRGSVTVRWYGVSNGYYSESVDFEECRRPQDWNR